MAHRPLTTPAVVSARSILLYAGCGTALAALLLVHIGCASFGSLPGEVPDPEKNAVLCSCECDPPADPVAPSFKNLIVTGADDAAQGGSPPANLTGNQLSLG